MVEVTHESPPREVFELIVCDDDPVDPVSYAIYRAYRLPGIYPHREHGDGGAKMPDR